MAWKDMFLNEHNTGWGDYAGNLPTGLEYTEECAKCNNTFKSKILDKYGLCPSCKREEERMADRIMDRMGYHKK